MNKNHLLKILSSLIVEFSDVQAKNFYFQVAILERLSVVLKIDIRDWGQSNLFITIYCLARC